MMLLTIKITIVVMGIILLSWTIIITSIYLVAGLIDCDNVISDTKLFVGTCNNKWSNLQSLLRPTQLQVGYAWIQYKFEKSFTSSKDAQTEIDSSIAPAVIGPDSKFYIVDDHHTLSALDYSGYDSTIVTLNIICDKRNKRISQFWKEMEDEKLVYLIAHPYYSPNSIPVAIDYTDLPSSFVFQEKTKSFLDDPWRSMAGYSRKVTDVPKSSKDCTNSKYCYRCFYRGCVNGYEKSGAGVPFFEFRWSYYMNYATYYDTSYWPSKEDWQTFYQLYTSLPSSPSDVSKINTNDWFSAADKIIPLCRGSNTGNYLLPSNLYDDNCSLPGYVQGYEQLDDDPDCSSPDCSIKNN